MEVGMAAPNRIKYYSELKEGQREKIKGRERKKCLKCG